MFLEEYLTHFQTVIFISVVAEIISGEIFAKKFKMCWF